MPQTASMPIPQLPQPDLTPACMTGRCGPFQLLKINGIRSFTISAPAILTCVALLSEIRSGQRVNDNAKIALRSQPHLFLKIKQASRVPGNLPAVRRSRSQPTSPPVQGTRRDDFYKNPGVPSTHFFQRGFPSLPLSASHLLIRRIGFHRFSHSLPAFCTEDAPRLLVSVTSSSARPVRPPSAMEEGTASSEPGLQHSVYIRAYAAAAG